MSQALPEPVIQQDTTNLQEDVMKSYEVEAERIEQFLAQQNVVQAQIDLHKLLKKEAPPEWRNHALAEKFSTLGNSFHKYLALTEADACFRLAIAFAHKSKLADIAYCCTQLIINSLSLRDLSSIEKHTFQFAEHLLLTILVAIKGTKSADGLANALEQLYLLRQHKFSSLKKDTLLSELANVFKTNSTSNATKPLSYSSRQQLAGVESCSSAEFSDGIKLEKNGEFSPAENAYCEAIEYANKYTQQATIAKSSAKRAIVLFKLNEIEQAAFTWDLLSALLQIPNNSSLDHAFAINIYQIGLFFTTLSYEDYTRARQCFKIAIKYANKNGSMLNRVGNQI